MTDWIQTYTGKKVHPLHPRIDEIDIVDIAHGLSNVCRFNGQTKFFLSVAEHSIRVASICPKEDALWGLLHDASEAYLCDIPRPVKVDDRMGFYRESETTLLKVIAEKFKLPWPIPESVHKADRIMLLTERRDLMAPVPWSFVDMEKWDLNSVEPLEETIVPALPVYVEKQFLWWFEKLAA